MPSPSIGIPRRSRSSEARRPLHRGRPWYLYRQAATIIQDDRFDATASVTVCPVTTSAIDAPLIRIPIEPSAATGIEQPSQIMVDKVTTMPRAGVRDHFGRLADIDLVRLDRALFVFLGLAG